MVTSSEKGRLSPWLDSGSHDEQQAREHATRLELRASAESEIAVRDEYVRLLAIAPGERVLDVGCGSGAATRTLAQRVAPNGRVTGIDPSGALLRLARGFADKTEYGNLIELREGDCRALPFPDHSFDAVLAATALSHIPGPERALAEMVRVTRPGGRVGIFDVDGDLTLFAHPDREVTRRIIACYSDLGWINSWLMRELPALLPRLGVTNVKTKAFMPLETGGYYALRAERTAEAAATAGAISASELASWLKTLRELITAQHFLGGQVHLFVWGVRPA
jgi:ubiquinone/menaquinone biosynthesis C-methylase UbiE